ncbi:MAG: hypothetical protein AB1634_02005 [Thermodesulfobacteriota bacterium]
MLSPVLLLILLLATLWPQPAGAAATTAANVETAVIKVLEVDANSMALGYTSVLHYDRKAEELYVLHSGAGGRIALYAGADYFPTFTLGEGRELGRASAVLVTGDGLLYAGRGPLAQGELPAIKVYDGAFIKVREMTLDGFEGASEFSPRHLVEGSRGRLIMAGSNYPGALVLDREGRFLHVIAPTDTVRGGRQVADIIALDTDREGNLYLLSEGMGRVYVYDAEERFLFRFGEKGGSSGKLARARGVAVDDRAGRIYVADYLRHGVNVYDLKGRYLFEFGGQGSGRGWLAYPSDVCVDAYGRVIVADTFNKRVQVFEIHQK